jgi:type IV secretory pathway TrbF-like protein
LYLVSTLRYKEIAMAKAPWKYDAATGLVTFEVPQSVERVQPLDDDEMLEVFEVAKHEGNKVTLTRYGLVHFVDSVRSLASDQVMEDLSVGGALRWARNRAKALVAAGWAKDSWSGLDEAGEVRKAS